MRRKTNEYKDWARRETIVALECGYLSEEGLIRHLKEHAASFGVAPIAADKIIHNLLSKQNG